MEEWKDIKGYEGLYQVSSFGRVKSLPRFRKNGKGGGYLSKEMILKSRCDRDGYHELNLSFKNKPSTKKVHRLVAIEFIVNPNNFTEINHIDLNKSNNNYLNLEWCTHTYNVKHYFNKL